MHIPAPTQAIAKLNNKMSMDKLASPKLSSSEYELSAQNQKGSGKKSKNSGNSGKKESGTGLIDSPKAHITTRAQLGEF